jgi:hypothetical protein
MDDLPFPLHAAVDRHHRRAEDNTAALSNSVGYTTILAGPVDEHDALGLSRLSPHEDKARSIDPPHITAVELNPSPGRCLECSEPH